MTYPNTVISMPSQLFTLASSFKAASNGNIYIGEVDTDPTIPSNQIQVYLEQEDGNLVPVSQPIKINSAGYPVYSGQIAKFVANQAHSMAVYDAYNVQQFYFSDVYRFNPIAPTLDRIDEITVKRFADVAEMQAYTEMKEDLRVCTGAGLWDITTNSNGLPVQNGLYAIPLNGLHVRDFGAIPNDPTTNTVSQALQAAFDALPAYGSAQNGGSFQPQVEIVFNGSIFDRWYLNEKVTVEYKNNWKFKGINTFNRGDNLNSDDYMAEFIACNHCDIGEAFVEGGAVQKYGFRISGDGFTGTKRNSTNIKFNKLFFKGFASGGYALDTLSPNGIFGDYSIDDSGFNEINFLGCAGGCLRLASSEIRISQLKFSFCGDLVNGTDSCIYFGTGTSLIADKVLVTNCGPLIDAAVGASIGRISINQLYMEACWEFYKQSGGVIRSLEIEGGYCTAGNYAAGHPDAGQPKAIPFIDLDDTYGELYISGSCWVDATFETIKLGTNETSQKASLVWKQGSNITSFKSHCPKAINGVWSKEGAVIQPSSSNDKRHIHAVSQGRNHEWVDIFVDTSLTADQPERLRFGQLADALDHCDSLGLTRCRVMLTGGQAVRLYKPVSVCGVVQINATAVGCELRIQNANDLNVYGHLDIVGNSSTRTVLEGVDGGIVIHPGGKLALRNIESYATTSATGHIINPLGGELTLKNHFVSIGDICSNSFAPELKILSDSIGIFGSSAIIRTLQSLQELIYYSGSVPGAGYWPKGTINKRLPSVVAASSPYSYVCVSAGSPGDWKLLSSIGA